MICRRNKNGKVEVWMSTEQGLGRNIEEHAHRFMLAFQRDLGYPPTAREVGAFVGVKAGWSLQQLMERLVEQGLVKKLNDNWKNSRAFVAKEKR